MCLEEILSCVLVIGMGTYVKSLLELNKFKVVLTFYIMNGKKLFFLTAFESAIKK
jgi:hypothetical protein